MNSTYEEKLRTWAKLATGLHGYTIEIVKSPVDSLLNISGEIIDETTNMIRIRSQDKDRWVPKKGFIFKIFISPNVVVRVKGEVLLGKPEDRMKRKKHVW